MFVFALHFFVLVLVVVHFQCACVCRAKLNMQWQLAPFTLFFNLFLFLLLQCFSSLLLFFRFILIVVRVQFMYKNSFRCHNIFRNTTTAQFDDDIYNIKLDCVSSFYVVVVVVVVVFLRLICKLWLMSCVSGFYLVVCFILYVYMGNVCGIFLVLLLFCNSLCMFSETATKTEAQIFSTKKTTKTKRSRNFIRLTQPMNWIGQNELQFK